MQLVILAGGYGTRISEESILIPKPLISIGDKPIIWHIMKYYSTFGISEFIICLGYKGHKLKEYFFNYSKYTSDLMVKTKNSDYKILTNNNEDWEVTLIDTGDHTMTGGRIARVKNYIRGDSFFCTYGDGLSNIDINDLSNAHKNNKTIATISAVRPPGRFGSLKINNNRVSSFEEKIEGTNSWINGGFFVFDKDIFNYLDGDECVLEREPMEKLAKDNQISSFKHDGFWQPMDTLRDKNLLEKMWNNEQAPWKIW